VKSAVSGMTFPALPGAKASQAAAVQFQLERSQWLSAEELQARQLAQLRNVVQHAAATVPYYQELFAEHGIGVPAELDPSFLRRLPVLRRAMVNEALRSTAVPKDHGKQHRIATSGATGTPVRLWGTGLTGFLWRAFTLREHLWHGRDLKAKLGAIRWAKKDFAAAPHGARWPGWGDAVELLFENGPSCMPNVVSPLADQVAWLLAERPRYLVSFPSNLAALAQYCLERGIGIPGLAEVRTIGEMLSAQQRVLFKRAWDCKVTDMYTCEEAGYLALQCP
jgi:phenylacetate-CoA ligase